MSIQKVLEELDGLLSGWGFKTSDWIFTAQYATRLLGYRSSVRHHRLIFRIQVSLYRPSPKEGANQRRKSFLRQNVKIVYVQLE